MIRLIIAFGMGLLATHTLAQSNDFGTISGVITDPDGGTAPNIPVQARNVQAGTLHKTSTSASGAYTFAQLAAGTYQILVPAVGFTLDKFEQKGLAVRAGQTLRADIKMSWGPNLGTPWRRSIPFSPQQIRRPVWNRCSDCGWQARPLGSMEQQ
jgi:hypothetical protein